MGYSSFKREVTRAQKLTPSQQSRAAQAERRLNAKRKKPADPTPGIGFGQTPFGTGPFGQ